MKENIKYLAKFLKNHKLITICSLIFAIIEIICSTLIPYFIGESIDVLFDSSLYSNSDLFLKSILIRVGILLGIIVLAVVSQYLFVLLFNNAVNRVIKDIRLEIFEKINSSKLKQIDKMSQGDILARCINDTDNIYIGLINGFKQLYEGVLTLILLVILMLYQSWILSLIVVVLTPISLFISYKIAKGNDKYFKKQAKENGNISSLALQDINNLELIQSSNAEEERIKVFKENNENQRKVAFKAMFFASIINPTTRLTNYIVYTLVGTVGVILVVKGESLNLNSALSIGTVIAFLQYASKFAKPLNEISSCVGELQTANSSLNRVREFIALENEENGDKDINNLIDNIEINNLKFGYNDSHYIYENLSLNIKKGSMYAIIGPTGCGKTTLISLLLKFYSYQDGEIKINNEKLTSLKNESYRNNFGIVLQESWIFEGSVYDNLTYLNKDVTKEEVIEVCKKCNCLDFIEQMPNKFDTIISNNYGLSVGQQQLLSIARVMLANKEFIILDEATSNVDIRTEFKIVQALDELMKNRTSIVIAHRLSTIKKADKIFVLNDGKIVEEGNHNELIAKNNLYSKIYNSQF
ncbi:MAG: ABC transporter ATP-binding protein [Bacilli bacterium]|nr:ABC transporter ATP-binding protein [Bacilli bacterium]